MPKYVHIFRRVIKGSSIDNHSLCFCIERRQSLGATDESKLCPRCFVDSYEKRGYVPDKLKNILWKSMGFINGAPKRRRR